MSYKKVAQSTQNNETLGLFRDLKDAELASINGGISLFPGIEENIISVNGIDGISGEFQFDPTELNADSERTRTYLNAILTTKGVKFSP